MNTDRESINEEKFDMESFKKYVNTYDAEKHGLNKNDVIIKDMLYGMGLSLNEEKYRWAAGYRKFKSFLKSWYV